jgi:two-component system alkaline phosphatase synthesis response regulator PhoP
MSGKRILIIDDERQVQDVVRLCLEDFGFELHGVTEIGDLEASIRDVQPDLILLDQTLPGMDGLALCQEMRNHPPTAEIPIVLMTDGPRSLTSEEAAAGKPDALLAKPFRPVNLLSSIYRCLKISSGVGGA